MNPYRELSLVGGPGLGREASPKDLDVAARVCGKTANVVLNVAGYDLNEGIAAIYGGKIYYGSDAVVLLSSMTVAHHAADADAAGLRQGLLAEIARLR